MYKWIIIIVLTSLILSGCAAPTSDPVIVQQMVKDTLAAVSTQTAYPTNTPDATYTPFATYTPLPTYTDVPTYTPQLKVVTATFTATPEYTPTQTSTSTEMPTLAPTIDSLKMPKGDGYYLVGVEIAPGVWDSDGTGDGCYWEVTTATGDIIANDFGLAGGTAYIPLTAFQVQFQDCGNWTWLQD